MRTPGSRCRRFSRDRMWHRNTCRPDSQSGLVARSALTSRPGCCDTLAPGSRSYGPMLSRLPFGDSSFTSVAAVMIHTDVPDYRIVLGEAWRVLAPGGRFVHIGVHPCFCGGFADRTDPEAIVVRPGYLDGHWTKESWTDRGLRDKVGAMHLPLPALLQSFVDAGFVLDGMREGGEPIPTVLAVRALKPKELIASAPNRPEPA